MEKPTTLDLNYVPAAVASGTDLFRISGPRGETLWETDRAQFCFRDNIPVAVGYSLNLPESEKVVYVSSFGPVDRRGQVRSGFSAAGWSQTAQQLMWWRRSYQRIVLKIKTGGDVSGRQTIMFWPDGEHPSSRAWKGHLLEMSGSKLKFTYLCEPKYVTDHELAGKTKLETYTTYFVKLVAKPEDGEPHVQLSLSRDGSQWTEEIKLSKISHMPDVTSQLMFGARLESKDKKLFGDATGPVANCFWRGEIDFSQSEYRSFTRVGKNSYSYEDWQFFAV